MAIGVAFRAFFAALLDRNAAQRLERALAPETTQTPAAEQPKAIPAAKPAAPPRSDALTLLGTLQREARLLDLVQESLESFEDAQIGAAAREVLRDCRKTLDRIFAIEPLSDAEEGTQIAIDSSASPNRLRIGSPATSGSGTITHRGWKATRCELPKWSGHRDDAWLLAPVEVE